MEKFQKNPLSELCEKEINSRRMHNFDENSTKFPNGPPAGGSYPREFGFIGHQCPRAMEVLDPPWCNTIYCDPFADLTFF